MENALTIREARRSNYHGVMAIAELYDGCDYLPSMYEEIVTSSKNKCYVGLVNGVIIAFVFGCLVDDGETVVYRAARVKDAFEGQGVSFSLLMHMHNQFSATGRVRYEAITTSAKHKDDIKIPMKTLLFKNVSSYQLNPKDVTDISNDLNTTHVLHKSDLKEVFSSEATCQHVFQNNRIIVDWVPFRLLPSNIDGIMTPATLVLGTYYPNTSHSDVIWTCLSIGTHYRCKIGLAYVADVFGDDVIEAKKHIHAQLKNAMLEAAGQYDKVWFVVITSPNINIQDIDSMLSDLKIHKDLFEVLCISESPFVKSLL